MAAAIRQYAAVAHVDVDDALCKPRFVHRLVHAADHCFGLLVELICESIGEMILTEEDTLSPKSFAACFARRSGCPEGLNPFVVEDFLALDVRKLLQPEPSPETRRRWT